MNLFVHLHCTSDGLKKTFVTLSGSLDIQKAVLSFYMKDPSGFITKLEYDT